MIAEIIPIIKLPPSQEYFDYLIPETLTMGDLTVGRFVEIDFRGKKILGIIRRVVQKKSPYRLKPIKKVLPAGFGLTAKQLDWLLELAKFLYLSPAQTAASFLPDLLRRNFAFSIQPISTSTKKKFKKIPLPKFSQYNFIEYNDQSNKLLFYSNLAASSSGQVLFICPDINSAVNLQTVLQENLGKEVALITAALNKKQASDYWLRIQTGGIKVIVGTKKALFYPWKNLSQIVIDQSGDLNHKQWDQSPRYHTREVAEIMATIYGAKLNLVSVLPDPTTFLKIKQGQIRYLRLAAKPTARIDWQTNPDWDWNGLAISQKINQVKTAAGPLIVLVNRLAYGQIIKCRDCGFIWECPGCHSPLHYSRKNNQAYCGHCHFQTNLPLSCPHCRGQNIATVGLGQEKILAQLTRAYPTKKIEVFNAQSLELDKRAEILICSKAIFPYLNQQSFAGVIIPVLEQFLTPADLTTQWELFYLLKLLSAHRLDIFVQSFSEHNFASYFKNPLAYLKTELKNLEQLHLPPFTTLVKIAVRHRSLSQAEKQAQSLWQKIKQSLPRVEIAAPQLALPPRQDNQYRYNLIISRVNSGDIAKLAELSYAEGTLDINPLSLLD